MLNASQLGLRDFRKDREESPNKPQLLPHIQVASLVPAAAASLQTASPELAAAASEARRFRFVSDIPRALKIASCSSEDLMPQCPLMALVGLSGAGTSATTLGSGGNAAMFIRLRST